MISITQGISGGTGAGQNNCVMTLSDSTPFYPVDYLFLFTNLGTGATVVSYCQDSSPNTPAYNQFFFSEVSGITGPNPQNGQIALPNAGEWKYQVYAMGATVPHNLNTTQGTLVQTGLLNVISSNSPLPEWTTPPLVMPSWSSPINTGGQRN